MAVNLKSFFDLDKVEFTKEELELPYEDFYFPKLDMFNFSYSSDLSQSSMYLSEDYCFEKLLLDKRDSELLGEAA